MFRPRYPHPVSSELENNGIRVAVGNSSVTERRRQTQRGRTHGAGCVRQWFRTAEPLGERRYENWSTHTHMTMLLYSSLKSASVPLGVRNIHLEVKC